MATRKIASASAKKAPAAAKKSPSATAAKTTKKASEKVTEKKAPAKAAAAKPAAAAKKPAAKPRSPFDAKFLESQHAMLVTERETYLRQAENYEAEAFALTEDREPGDVQFDEESGDGDTIAVERERDLALGAQARQMIVEIDAALVRMEEGTYGICRVSGEPIPKERLKAIPWATERVEFKAGGFGRR